ncbi:MAG: glutamate 5-kinase [Candidatus Hermodarchaeia archaeon]|jgi:glutamate 5-kinase
MKLPRKLIVVKVGTSSLTYSNGRLNIQEMKKLVSQISVLVKKGFKIILVTSGAVASGVAELEVRPNPNDIIFQQACAAVGQSILMAHYRTLFRDYDLKVSQILLTKEDLSKRTSYLHTCNVIDRLLQLGVIPIINENDVTSTDELMPLIEYYDVNFSDNDLLSVLIANAIQADLLIILSNVDGLYTMNPQKPAAQLIPHVDKITPELKAMVEGKSILGRGGMKTKLQAAEIATQGGIPVIIANSYTDRVLLDAIAGKPIGTFFRPTGNLSRIKKWIAYGASTKGLITVNAGAEKAIYTGSSLLPIGITAVSGQFTIGDVLSLVNAEGKRFGRGIVNYTLEEIKAIKGLKTNQIKKRLGYIRRKEVVTRKYIHLLKENEIDDS